MPAASSRFRRLRVLAVPVALAAVVTAAAPGLVHIRVQRGDTLSAIAERHHTTVARLVALNHLPGNGNLIYAGQQLTVPGTVAGTTSHDVVYTVRRGDTLSGIAARYHVSMGAIASRNHLPRSLVVMIGQRLTLPGVAAPTTSTSRYPSAVVATAAQHRAELARRSVPSRTHMQSLIIAAAHRYGIDPALALAIGWQESGFNQRVVSDADAIGAMQVLPSTGEFVSRYLAHRRLDLLDGADNATAGVALLASLVHGTGRADLAVAAYYQGLGSVRAHGMYGETKAYVRNVLALRHRFDG